MATKNYNLRTRDMYHPLYSTYQLDYLRPNVWEIVIGASSPASINQQVSQAGNTTGTGNMGNYAKFKRNSSSDYAGEGHSTLASFSKEASGGLSLYCDKFTLQLPKSNVIQVPWISGVTQLAGRNNQPFQITAEFYAGLGSKSIDSIGSNKNTALGSSYITDDCLRLLYAWRNLCFDARTGQIGLAPNYKKPATIFMYDPSGVKVIYEFTVHGLWPSAINDIELDVSADDIVKLSVTMQADFVYMEDETNRMDDFYRPSAATQAGNTSKDMLYGV